jgi:acyl-CoA thioesterase-1
MSMKIFWIVLLGASVACQPERNMDGATDAKQASADAVPAAPAAAASNGESAVSDSVRGKVSVLFFGTSLTAGYGLDPSQAFPLMVAAKAAAAGMPIKAINAGLSGETSAGALRRIDWALKQPVDVVVLETGGNDALRALDASALKANLTAIVGRIRKAQPKAKILLAMMEAPPNFGAGYTTSFREAYATVAKSDGLTLLPFLLDSVAGNAELNQEDGIHPNLAGERIVADNVWRALKPVVAEIYGQRKPRTAKGTDSTD